MTETSIIFDNIDKNVNQMIKCKIILSFAERKKITLTNYIDQFEKLSYFYFQYNDDRNHTDRKLKIVGLN